VIGRPLGRYDSGDARSGRTPIWLSGEVLEAGEP